MPSWLRRARNLLVIVIPALALNGCAIFLPAQIDWNDTRWCVPPKLKYVLHKVARKYGPVSVHSTHRWPLENWRKGGKPKSYHLTCRAVDFSVRGDSQGVIYYLRGSRYVGGYSRYPQGIYHIDTGPRRTW
jgi:uncharacterized protein YcbK (DUF882 family)